MASAKLFLALIYFSWNQWRHWNDPSVENQPLVNLWWRGGTEWICHQILTHCQTDRPLVLQKTLLQRLVDISGLEFGTAQSLQWPHCSLEPRVKIKAQTKAH